MTVKTFLTNKINSKRFRLNGLVPSGHLPNKRQLRQAFSDHILYRAEQLPPKVDLRFDMTPVEDQSRIGSCAANCLAGAYEYLTKKSNGRNTDVSRLFIYYNARVKDQKSATVVDSGCTMTSAIEALEEFGTCLESVWPYDISRVNARPSDSAYQEAQRHKITEALRINPNLYEMKSCLAQGFPFAFGLRLYSSFDQAATTGVVPMPNALESGRASHASHALLAVGYSEQSKAFIVRNSWGEQWGDRGYCYIPYDYLTNPNLIFDAWTVRKIATDNFGRENWDVQDVVNYIRPNRNDLSHNNNFNDNSRVIEAVEEDDDNDRKNGFNDYNQSNGYDPRNGFNDYNRSNGYNDDPWNQYQMFGGENMYPKQKKDRHHERYDDYSPKGNFYYDQFREEDNYFGFRGGYSDFDQFVNNGPNFFNNQFAPPMPPASPPPFFRPQQYGFNYGYATPFNPFY